jgi:homoserine dehydrogenase
VSSRCRIALLGFGTVGSAVAERLADAAADSSLHGLHLTHIFDRRADAKSAAARGLLAAPHVRWTPRIEDVLRSDVDLIVETVGGVDPASDWIRDALLAGKSVVTANKQVIARDGARLLALAGRQDRQLRFEAAVGGVMPIVRAINGLAGDRITRIVAILNGTTNAVLSQMEVGASLESALAEAQARGYAEADPSADLDGDDARAKLAIVCALAFGLQVDPRQIPARTCASIGPADFERARQTGATVRQLAHADYDRESATLTAWVAPTLVNRDSLFARTTGPRNAALITGEYSGEIGIFGTGAGGRATAVAILSDVLAIARADFRRQHSDFRFSGFDCPRSSFDSSLAEAV